MYNKLSSQYLKKEDNTIKTEEKEGFVKRLDNKIQNSKIINWLEKQPIYNWIDNSWLINQIKKGEKYTILAKPRYAIPSLLILKAAVQWTAVYYIANETLSSENEKPKSQLEKVIDENQEQTMLTDRLGNNACFVDYLPATQIQNNILEYNNEIKRNE